MMMNNEEFERKMAFIVNQQAQFTVDMDKLRASQAEMRASQAEDEIKIRHLFEKQARTDEAIDRLVTVQAETEEVVTRLAYVTNVGFKELDAKINALVDAQVRTEDSLRNLGDAQNELTESQKKTDEALRKLIDRLDRRSNDDGNTG